MFRVKAELCSRLETVTLNTLVKHTGERIHNTVRYLFWLNIFYESLVNYSRGMGGKHQLYPHYVIDDASFHHRYRVTFGTKVNTLYTWPD